VVIADFTEPDGIVTELGRALADDLSVAIAGSDSQIVVVSRSRLRTLLQDRNVLTTDLRMENAAQLVESLLGADALVIGNVMSDGTGYELSVRLATNGEKEKAVVATTHLLKTNRWADLAARRIDERAAFANLPMQKGSPVECLECPPPTYPKEARKKKKEGTVVLQVTITAEGRATNITVVKGLGSGLDEKALEAVRNWKFKPAYGPGGRPIPVYVTIEVNFRLSH
jgi:TonB family protein